MAALGTRLSKAVSVVVKSTGFLYVAKRNTFFREETHGFSDFLWTSHPTVSGGLEGMSYQLVIGVRHRIVEDSVNQLGLIYGEENQKFTTTVTCPLSLFPISKEKEYSYFLENSAPDKEVERVTLPLSSALYVNREFMFVNCAN